MQFNVNGRRKRSGKWGDDLIKLKKDFKSCKKDVCIWKATITGIELVKNLLLIQFH